MNISTNCHNIQYTYTANKLHSQCTYHCTNANVPHSTWQITLYQPPTVYNAHSTRQCLTVYIATKQAGLPVCRLSSCQTEPIIQTSCNQSANFRPAHICVQKLYILYPSWRCQMWGGNFNLGSKKSFMWASFDLFRQLASDSLSWWRARLAFNAIVKTRLNDRW